MKICFEMEKCNSLKSSMSVEVEWNAPCIPSVGHGIEGSILSDGLTPKEYYDNLTVKEQKVWNTWLEEDLSYGDVSKEELEETNLRVWISGMHLIVKSVVWNKNTEDEYCVSVFLEQTQVFK